MTKRTSKSSRCLFPPLLNVCDGVARFGWNLLSTGRSSAFMSSLSIITDLQVSVSTKSAKSDKQFVWEGQADTSSYTIREEMDSDKLIPRGTSITLHLKVFLFFGFFITR